LGGISKIVVDSSGNVYTTGNFSGTVDFDPGTGVYNLTSGGNADIFISKFDSSGNFVWAKSFGDGTAIGINGLVVDSSSNIYTTGFFTDTADFDPGTGVHNLTSAGRSDVFISKLDSSGNFVWAKRLGGENDDNVAELAVDSIGNVYATGNFAGTVDFDPGIGVNNLTTIGRFADLFISKLDRNGNFVWAKSLGGSAGIGSPGLAVDGSGNVYTSGYFQETVDFDPGTGVHNLISNGATSSLFISKLDRNGNFVWAKSLSGTGDIGANGLGLDSSGNIYVTGGFVGTIYFAPGAGVYSLASAGGIDIFISKLDSSGNFIWTKNMGGTGDDSASRLAVDNSGIYTAGVFFGTADFDPGAGVYNLSSAGRYDIFINRLDSSGKFVWAKSLGGENDDRVTGLAVDSSGNVYTSGSFRGTVDFDPGAGVYNLVTGGETNIFLSKLSQVAQAPRSEIFWRNPNGLEVIWQLDNTKLVNGVLINSPFNTPTWNLKGVADMDGDGIKDHIYQNATTFELRYLPFTTTNGQSPGVKAPVTPVFNNAAKFGTPGAIATPGGGWDLVGIEHVSGSAQADLIFYSRALDRLVFWETNATGQIVDAGFFTSTQSPGGQGTGAANAWSVQAVADFTGDGKVDFLWRNTAGVTVLWKVNGTVIDLAASQILPTMAPSFELRGVGDFNGDGIKDAVWRDQRANITRFWTFNTRGIATQTADNNAIVGAGFQIEAIADFNGDGKSDLIWRDPVSDRSVVWNFDLGANPGPVFQLSAVLPGSNYIRNFLPGVTDNVPVVNGDRAWDIDAASGI
jgi:FG-GAP-like repeat/Beta-propeller repeat